MTENKKTKTFIMHKANLSYRLLTNYLNDLLRLKLLDKIIEKQPSGKDKIAYKISQKGISLLKDYEEYQRFSKKIADYLNF